MDKQILVYLYIRILLNNKKGQTTDTFMDKSQKHYAEQKKPDTKHKFCLVPFLWNSRKFYHSFSDRKQTSGCLGRGWKEGKENFSAQQKKNCIFWWELQECINWSKPIEL